MKRRPMSTRVKICCIASLEEARLALRYGAGALGLVSAMPSGPGVIGEDMIASIARRIPPGVGSFLLTSRLQAEGIIEQQRRCGVNTLQLVDRVSESCLRTLRQKLPGVGLVQVVHVTGPDSLHEALAVSPFVDALLLDSGNPAAAVRELGGTGRVHDWRVSRAIVDSSPVPVYLAGGLRPDNVADGIKHVRPFGVDVCTGVRRNGELQEDLLATFFKQVHSGTLTGEATS
jgi:phosphoribosylanthranilate isomerase